ncbi:MAG: hypothetical protein MRJ92_07655 [Nitrospira sp.]|nr:hypothetical protein [Nitrospira sp.]
MKLPGRLVLHATGNRAGKRFCLMMGTKGNIFPRSYERVKAEREGPCCRFPVETPNGQSRESPIES